MSRIDKFCIFIWIGGINSTLVESGEDGLQDNRDGKLNEDLQMVWDFNCGESRLGDNRDNLHSPVKYYTRNKLLFCLFYSPLNVEQIGIFDMALTDRHYCSIPLVTSKV